MSRHFIDERSLRPHGPTLDAGALGNSAIAGCRCDEVPDEYLLAKTYREPPSERDVDRLRKQIDWREDLPSKERDELDAQVAWPRGIITRGGSPVGVLIPRAPKSMLLPHPNGRALRPFKMNNLLPDKDVAERAGLPYYALPDRMAALGNVVRAVRWLHHRDAVIGDLNGNNILVEAGGHAVYLVDADSMSGPWGVVSPVHPPSIRSALGRQADEIAASNDFVIAGHLIVWVLTGHHGLTSYPAVLDEYLSTPVRQVARAAMTGEHATVLDPSAWDEIARLWPRCVTQLGAFLPTDDGLMPWDGSSPTVSHDHAVFRGESAGSRPDRTDPTHLVVAGATQSAPTARYSGVESAASALRWTLAAVAVLIVLVLLLRHLGVLG